MTKDTILIVDDDVQICEMLSETLRMENYKVVTAENGEQALALLENNKEIVLLISDVKMQPMNGHALLKHCKNKYPDLHFIMMTGAGSIENAVKTLHAGAVDYLTKPFNSDSLIELVNRYAPLNKMVKDDVIAADEKSKQLLAVAKRVALTEASVMISGESGVGKEVISRYIHQNSNRATGPFVAINCAAIPENMLESELFGYEKGAFTGAYKSKAGKFEQAQGGTLLLDEITEMDISLQAKLLRVLQEREIERLGGSRSIQLNVRILATTNRNIYKVVSEGHFREDLFYRLNVFPMHIVPLRDRVDDIFPLSNKILNNYLPDNQIVNFSSAAKKRLNQHTWPGNVRELDNVIQRALILKSNNTIEAKDIHLENNFTDARSDVGTSNVTQTNNLDKQNETEDSNIHQDLNCDLKAREHDLIISALKEKRSRKEVAEKLGISSRTLRYKLARMRDSGIAIPA